MSDQADGLRQMVQARSAAVALADPPPAGGKALEPVKARSLVLTSGKGGVGTSNLALNLAIALGEAGQRVVLVDADLGLANIDLLCGLAPASDLGDVLAGDGPLADAIVTGPGGIRILPGVHAMRTLVEVLGDGPKRLVAELAELEAGSDFVLVDAGSGLGAGVATLAAAADLVAIVTTPEPTSLADAHAAIGRFRKLAGPGRLRAVVNQAASAAEASDVLARLAATSRQFLGTVVTPPGARPGRPPRAAGGPDAPAVRAGVSQRDRLARRAPPGTRPDRGAPAREPPPRLLRRPGGALGAEPGRPLTLT